MKIGVFDLETNGLPEDNPKVLEFASAIWDTDTGRILSAKSFLVNSLEENEIISKEITKINGLTTDIVKKHGNSVDFLISEYNRLVQKTDCLMARNGIMFDVPIMALEFERKRKKFTNAPCIDDYLDVEYPDFVKGRSLSHVACDFGFQNHFAHTGLGDVLTLVEVFKRAGFDVYEALANAETPLVEVIAKVSYMEREKASRLGFKWEPKNKIWHKNYRKRVYEKTEFDFETEIKEYSFDAMLDGLD